MAGPRMKKIRCPHCGHWQYPLQHLSICNNCYADIREIVTQFFQGEIVKEEQKAIGGSKGDFFKGIWRAAKHTPGKEGRRLQSATAIFKKTIGTFYRRFGTLYPFIFLSLSFFMLIGIFISAIGVKSFFPEFYPWDPSDILPIALGIIACLSVSFCAQGAFILAVANRELRVIDALSRSLQRLGSYVTLIVLMGVLIGMGATLLLIPGVIIGVLFLFAPFVLAAENVGVIAALSKSVQYVAGSWLQVFLRLAPVALMIILLWYFFAYAGTAILMAAQNVFVFVFIISALVSLPIMFFTIFVFNIYEDLRVARGAVAYPEVAPSPSVKPEILIKTRPVFTELPPFIDLIERAWSVYKERFWPLTVLNLVSYLPHAIHIAVLIVGYFGLTTFFEMFQAKGDFGLLVFLVLPKEILAFLIVGVLLYLILYFSSSIFGLLLYLLLDLAYVYAVADETVGVWEAIKKARMRLRGYFWVNLYRNFIVSTGFTIFVPGVVFWVWYSFTPYIFALQREEQTPLGSLWKSRELVRGLWGKVFKQLISLRVLPLALSAILIMLIFAGLPFYWIVGLFLSVFTPLQLPMFTIYSKIFWSAIPFGFYLVVGGFYIPFQEVFMYLLYRDLKDLKTARNDGSVQANDHFRN